MFLSDAAVDRLRAAAGPPDLSSDRYTIVQELGRGGMGTVYLAVDTLLERDVALKVPHAAVMDADLERRLQVEARVLASLEHPGIVPIHDSGRLADGRLFYVMKRVRGRTLREHLEDLHGMAERLRVFERICEPVAFAHARGFIHRDLKPENVMVGAFGEVMVMDWGVAKLVGATTAPAADAVTAPGLHDTHPGTIVGTRGFMPPEQARGDVTPVDVRADVYGLGALLFLLLTGEFPPDLAHPPGKGRAGKPESGAAAAINAHTGVPKLLRAVCARALAPEPDDRYPSVEALAADIGRYRAGQAVTAYRENLRDRATRFGRTYRTAILLVLAYVIMRAVVALTTGR